MYILKKQSKLIVFLPDGLLEMANICRIWHRHGGSGGGRAVGHVRHRPLHVRHLQYIRQQREGPEGNYRPALSRDVYSVEGVNISGILRIESLEANNYIPPSYSQCVHSTPNSPIESEVFLSPAHSNQSVRAWHQLQRAQRTPDSPPPTYDAIIGICKQCSQLRRGGRNKMRHMKSLGSEPALIRYTRGQQILFSDQRPISLPTTPQDDIEMQEVR
ncbi:hypothetical protein BSL78_25461 [Apostichopus japonicus]|uniref:Uncharacterized protein n=1 Tax=Stichopus japonicus TaxID=307972 RepID=A0A2G8JPP6_STIJA|nr:hypothetical protein BSL78_25461 [Apostichopus japonicus]